MAVYARRLPPVTLGDSCRAVIAPRRSSSVDYASPRKVQTKAPDGCRLGLRRAYIQVDAAKVIAEFGNWWLADEGDPTI